jgi:hypothetical protein
MPRHHTVNVQIVVQGSAAMKDVQSVTQWVRINQILS